MPIVVTTEEKLAFIQDRLKEDYGPDHYYTKEYSKHELNYSGSIPFWLADHLDDCINRGFMPRTLDIGPGYGTLACFATRMTRPGMVYTLDRLPYISDNVSLAWGLTTRVGDIERHSVQQCFDAIIMTEVLEHFNFHPVPTMMRVRELLNPFGKIFLSTPNAETWGRVDKYKSLDEIPVCPPNAKWHDPQWIDAHIWQYTLDELRSVVTTSGLKIVQLAHSKSAGGTHFNVVLQAQ